jgi:hypothetical protein
MKPHIALAALAPLHTSNKPTSNELRKTPR